MDVEQLLLGFGPFGVSVCDGPYRVFKWQRQNVYLIELTDHRLRGSRRSRVFGRAGKGGSFEIPYSAVISASLSPHPARLGLMQVLDIVYRDARGVREKSIATYNQQAQNAFAILRRYAPQVG